MGAHEHEERLIIKSIAIVMEEEKNTSFEFAVDSIDVLFYFFNIKKLIKRSDFADL